MKTAIYAVVAGGVNIDIGARSAQKLCMRDSNPGRVSTGFGGVGRNVAHNLSLLGVRTELLAALGEDACADAVTTSCRELGIGAGHMLRVPEGRTSTYVYVSDEAGDMALAVSDMTVCESLTPAYFERNLGLLNDAALVVADANLPEASLEYLAERLTAPLFVDPVSVSKAGKLAKLLPRIHTLKPNVIEAELLSGVPIADRGDARRAARRLIDLGVKRVFLSLGKAGFLAAAEDETVWQPALDARTVSSTGAGDALMAAAAWAYLRGENLTRTAALGAAAAAFAIECEETVNPALCAEAVLSRASAEQQTQRLQ